MNDSTKNQKRTRRDFLETSVKVAGTGALLSALPISVSAYAGAAGEIRVALVGLRGPRHWCRHAGHRSRSGLCAW